MLYKGVARTWSNRYHFTGGAPADATKWLALANAVTTAEKAIYQPSTGFTITGAVGYDAGSEIPVYTGAYALAATGAFAGWTKSPGDAAALIRYATNSRTVKNHPLYLFNYYHQVGNDGSVTNSDVLLALQRTAMATYAANWMSGFSDGSVTHQRCGPHGQTAAGALVATYLTHRDFPRG